MDVLHITPGGLALGIREVGLDKNNTRAWELKIILPCKIHATHLSG